MTINWKRNAIFAIIGAVTVFLVMFSAGKANADVDSFIWELENSTVSDFSGGKLSFLQIGYQICTAYYAGAAPIDIVASVEANYDFDVASAIDLYGITVDELC